MRIIDTISDFVFVVGTLLQTERQTVHGLRLVPYPVQQFQDGTTKEPTEQDAYMKAGMQIVV